MYAVISGFIVLLWAAPPEHIRDTTRRVLDPARYQTELPGAHAPTAAKAPAYTRSKGQGSHWKRSSALSVVSRALLYVLMIATVVILVVWLGGAYLGHTRDAALGQSRAGPDGPADDSAHHEVVARPLGDAEALARAGRYGEAIHTLLLRTLGALAERSAVRVPPSLTSREILARVDLPEAARSALGGLVSATEVSYFGGREPGPAEYQHCLECFHVFARAYARGQA